MIILGIIIGFAVTWFITFLVLDFLGDRGFFKVNEDTKKNFGWTSFFIALLVFINLLVVGTCDR